MQNITLENLSATRRNTIIWTLLSIMPIMGMAVDLVAPSLPAIATSLHTSTMISKNVVAIYLAGYALGNFFMGFLTDALGRQKLMRISLITFIIASLIAALFPKIAILLSARFLQGLSIGATAVLIRASFSDILPPEKLVRMGVLIGTMWGIGPVIGPILGGYLQFYFGWQAGFYFFAGITTVAFILVFMLVPETHFNRNTLNLRTIKHNLAEVMTHRLFMAAVILMGLVYSVIIGFNTVAPFLVQNSLHYSPVFFGHLALYLGLVFLAATFLCRYLLKYFQAKKIIRLVIHISLFITLLGLICSYFFPTNIILIGTISGLMFFTCGFIFPLSMGVGMSLFRHIAGTATATMYLFNILITSLVSFILSFTSIHNAISLIWIYVLLLTFCAIIYWVIAHPAQNG